MFYRCRKTSTIILNLMALMKNGNMYWMAWLQTRSITCLSCLRMRYPTCLNSHTGSPSTHPLVSGYYVSLAWKSIVWWLGLSSLEVSVLVKSEQLFNHLQPNMYLTAFVLSSIHKTLHFVQWSNEKYIIYTWKLTTKALSDCQVWLKRLFIGKHVD